MFTLALVEDYNTGLEWGDNWKLHLRGCAYLSRRNVEWKFDVDTVKDAVHAAFGDFIAEHVVEDGRTIQGLSFEEAKKYLHICACAKKVTA